MEDNNIIEKRGRGRPKKENRDDKEYYKNFIEKHGDKIKEKIQCWICRGHYTYFNKSKHIRTLKCRDAFKNLLELRMRELNIFGIYPIQKIPENHTLEFEILKLCKRNNLLGDEKILLNIFFTNNKQFFNEDDIHNFFSLAQYYDNNDMIEILDKYF